MEIHHEMDGQHGSVLLNATASCGSLQQVKDMKPEQGLMRCRLHIHEPLQCCLCNGLAEGGICLASCSSRRHRLAGMNHVSVSLPLGRKRLLAALGCVDKVLMQCRVVRVLWSVK